MDFSDAKKAYRRIFTAFPHIEEYLAGLADGEATRDAWANMLASCDTIDVTTIVGRLCSGELPIRADYESKGELGVYLRRLSIEQGRRREREQRMALTVANRSDHDGPRFSCATCQDKGLVMIWHPDCVSAIRLKGETVQSKYCSTACSCGAGHHLRTGHDKWRPLRSYNENVMCRWSSGDAQEVEDWINRPIEKHSNYRQEFAEYQ